MKTLLALAGMLGLAACLAPSGSRPDPARNPAVGPDDLRDNAIGANAAEPPWRDLMGHTTLQPPGRATHPAPSRDGRFFVYATTEFGPHPQIALRETSGAAATQLSQNGADNLFPRVSPDGKLVAYASNKEGNYNLFVARIDSPMLVTQITFESQDAVAPAWSPDGRRLVYSWKNPSGIWQLVLVDVGSRLKTYLGAGMYPDWSPNPKDPWIAFQSQPRQMGGRSSVWVVRPDGTSLRELVSDRAHGWSAMSPRFSNDGQWIAYATASRSSESRAYGAPDEADDIWIIRSDGTLDARLTDDLSAEWWPAWGADRVFFVSNRSGAPNIWSVQVKPLSEESR
jgi:Tol biopolymer transport system component